MLPGYMVWLFMASKRRSCLLKKLNQMYYILARQSFTLSFTDSRKEKGEWLR